MKKTLLFLLLVAGTYITSCKSWEEGWTEEYRTAFKQSCLEGDGRAAADADAYCDCVLEKTEKRYPTIADFMERKDEDAYAEALKACR